ncbi:hypothetical protein BC834DRAFT_907691 [Gloeopeniophorella convolvens]|nr:hypothetical protein BC834DRAFT_907691 [Gloeopeniophorella convolvens]
MAYVFVRARRLGNADELGWVGIQVEVEDPLRGRLRNTSLVVTAAQRRQWPMRRPAIHRRPTGDSDTRGCSQQQQLSQPQMTMAANTSAQRARSPAGQLASSLSSPGSRSSTHPNATSTFAPAASRAHLRSRVPRAAPRQLPRREPSSLHVPQVLLGIPIPRTPRRGQTTGWPYAQDFCRLPMYSFADASNHTLRTFHACAKGFS